MAGGDIRVATFDRYDTVIEWEGGAASVLYELTRRHERELPARELPDVGRSSSSSAEGARLSRAASSRSPARGSIPT